MDCFCLAWIVVVCSALLFEVESRPCAPAYPFPTNGSTPVFAHEHALLRRCREVTVEELEQCEIPNVYHATIGTTFHWHHYASLVSVIRVAKPDAVFMHGDAFPENDLFRKAVKKFGIILVETRPISKIFGNKILSPQHIADVIRMEAILKYGGYYLDLDVFTLRSFKPLLKYSAIIGYEKHDIACNGVIIAKPCSHFMQMWYMSYLTFNTSEWNYHSGGVPRKLVNGLLPSVIHVEPCNMHRPSCQPEERKYIFDTDGDSGLDLHEHYTLHLWIRLQEKNKRFIPAEFRNQSVKSLYGRLTSWYMGWGPQPVELRPRPADFKAIMPGCM